MSATSSVRITPLGDQALTVSWDVDAADLSAALGRRLEGLRGLLETVPATRALTVHFRPDVVGFDALEQAVRDALTAPRAAAASEGGALHRIEVRYDGPDLSDVAHMTGLTIAQVVARHAAPEYRVHLLGFVPGFAYLTGLDPALVLPRRAAPRPRVPAGSVAIAGPQTGIYPAATPGGWHLIGHTDVRPFDPARTPPALFAVGDRVRFVPGR